MNEQEFFWLAGLLEGEGSFLAGPPSKPNSVRIAITKTDVDVIARVAALWHVSYNEIRRRRSEEMGWKPYYFVHLRGTRAVGLMELLLPHMGQRRQSQIRKALSSYNPHLRNKLHPGQIAEIKAKLAQGHKHGEIAKEYGVDRSTISHIKAGSKPAYR